MSAQLTIYDAMPPQFVAASGGADSTAMALRMHERGERFALLTTPTGNEMGEVAKHLARLAEACDCDLIVPPGPTLEQLMEEFMALPSHAMRWCTRLAKIQPCALYLKAQRRGAVLCVGLRADEETREGGTYGEAVVYRTPLREWGWSRANVLGYLRAQGWRVPPRTDCAWCYDQRLSDWWTLWKHHPELWARGEAWEARTGHTFRSPSRDTWPAPLVELRARFEAGDLPRDLKARAKRGLPLLPSDNDDGEPEGTRCRVCVG